MKFYAFAQCSLTLSYHLVDGMGDDYLMSSYSSLVGFFFSPVWHQDLFTMGKLSLL